MYVAPATLACLHQGAALICGETKHSLDTIHVSETTGVLWPKLVHLVKVMVTNWAL